MPPDTAVYFVTTLRKSGGRGAREKEDKKKMATSAEKRFFLPCKSVRPKNLLDLKSDKMTR